MRLVKLPSGANKGKFVYDNPELIGGDGDD